MTTHDDGHRLDGGGIRQGDEGLQRRSGRGRPNPLTDHEREVLRAAADGSTNAEPAATLHLSQGTVRNHLSTAIRKPVVRNRTEEIHRAREKGWL